MCMLEELRKLPPVSPSRIVQTPAKLKAAQKQRKPQPVKRKSRNIIKEQSQGGEIEEEVNPISKLIQIQQALKEREPVYTVVEERGAPRRREFVIEVSASGRTARGIGTNKKMAKRLAAESMEFQDSKFSIFVLINLAYLQIFSLCLVITHPHQTYRKTSPSL